MKLTSLCLFTAATMPLTWAVPPSPLPKQIRNAKTVFVVNQGIEPKTMDVVYDEFRRWPRWELTEDREKADLIVVLSAQNYVVGSAAFGSGSASATATSYGNTTVARGYGSSQAQMIPLIAQTRYLTAIDPKSGATLITLFTRNREINGASRTGKALMNLFKARFPRE